MLQLLLAALVVFPVLWIKSEYSGSRELRLLLGFASILLSSIIAFALGTLREFDANMYFGAANKDLILNTITSLEEGNKDRVLECLLALKADYKPTYESRDNFDLLVKTYAKNVTTKPVFHEPGGFLWEDPNEPSEDSKFIETTVMGN